MKLRTLAVSLFLPLFVFGVLTVIGSAQPDSSTAAKPHSKHRAKHHSHGKNASANKVLERPVLFRVKNVNESKLACSTDGAEYNIRGDIVGTAAELENPSGVTLYLHGLGLGEFFWRYELVPGYDYAAALASKGHVSVTIDRLGYGASGKPDGFGSCIGGQATIAHQIIGDLKSGSYNGSLHPAFQSVGLVGHSAGGLITEVESYSFGDASAIGILAYADQGDSAFQLAEGQAATAICAGGGEPVEEVSGPTGYAKLGQTMQEAIESFFHSASKRVVGQTLPLLSSNPCGDLASYTAAPPTDLANIGSISVPVLAIQGGQDMLFPPPDVRTQATLYTGSPKVTFVELPKSAHAFTFESEHKRLESVVAKFLGQNGL